MIHNCRYIISAGLAIAIPMGAAAAESELSTVTIMGKTFYTYVAKKGESLFGIANHFGWDPQILTNT
ncbi:MAG: LysM peptidoglycan-binding domain-containing protein, partial [Muribaculaceae bacterium]|nr:LysM peptidoglycan-binding domain-containing protein [Muribaculaceae bacterium]